MRFLKIGIFFSVLLSSLLASSQSESLVLDGIYQGKDLYVKNPFSEDGVGFCVFEVYVNGELTRDEINSSAFAIDFNILGIEKGTPIKVQINHKDGCAPLILNGDAFKPHSTFEVLEIEVAGNNLSWKTQNESGALPFTIEQFRWNKWVTAGEVMGEGNKESSSYTFELMPYSGENKVRVKQVDYTGKARYSDAVTYDPSVPTVTFSPEKPESTITFSLWLRSRELLDYFYL